MSGDQNIWTKSTRLIQGPHVAKDILMFQSNTILYSIITLLCLSEKGPRHVQQKADNKSWQKTSNKAAAEKMIMIVMWGHDGQEGWEVGGELQNVLFLEYSFAPSGGDTHFFLLLIQSQAVRPQAMRLQIRICRTRDM